MALDRNHHLGLFLLCFDCLKALLSFDCFFSFQNHVNEFMSFFLLIIEFFIGFSTSHLCTRFKVFEIEVLLPK